MLRNLFVILILIVGMPLSSKAGSLFPLLKDYGYRSMIIYFMVSEADCSNCVNEESVRGGADLRMKSSDIGYTNFFLQSISNLEASTCNYANKNALRLVLDVYSEGDLLVYLSDGKYLFDRKLESCYAVPESFLDKFDIRI